MFTSVLAAAVRSGTPLLFAALGEILTERSGVLNLGLEGLMLIGAVTGFVGAYTFHNVYLAFLLESGREWPCSDDAWNGNLRDYR